MEGKRPKKDSWDYERELTEAGVPFWVEKDATSSDPNRTQGILHLEWASPKEGAGLLRNLLRGLQAESGGADG
jgi:hypothetical protein